MVVHNQIGDNWLVFPLNSLIKEGKNLSETILFEKGRAKKTSELEIEKSEHEF